ncbi:hypothetical protein ZOSMA_8G00020 [Zostera marina]|uniref:Uncharacterized protein n=1 Tax=Zostera marina TaxID=29655 RepID=A0A0K9NJB8_ZOSMR|nr:hypothetical protein ZOSMA_8G00020 [Zostera marina]
MSRDVFNGYDRSDKEPITWCGWKDHSQLQRCAVSCIDRSLSELNFPTYATFQVG